MTGPVFVDTNVIVYRYDTRVPAKQSRADDWLKSATGSECNLPSRRRHFPYPPPAEPSQYIPD